MTKPITMQDIRLVAGEGKLTAHDTLAACNVIIAQRIRDNPPDIPPIKFDDLSRMTLMAYADGYVMARRPGSMPFVRPVREWRGLSDKRHPVWGEGGE